MTTTDKASSRDQSSVNDRLAHLHEVGGAMLASFGDRLTGDYQMTLVARNAGYPAGSRDLVITEDEGRAIVETVLARHPDTAGSEERTGLFLADRLIAISAFRYALGRMTYMPSHVVDWLLANRLKLSRPDRELIVREIEEASELRRLGMDCDVATWTRLREALRSAPAEARRNASGSSVTTFGRSVDSVEAEERRRACLEAVLQQTQSAGPSATHVTLPIAVMDEVARLLTALDQQGGTR